MPRISLSLTIEPDQLFSLREIEIWYREAVKTQVVNGGMPEADAEGFALGSWNMAKLKLPKKESHD